MRFAESVPGLIKHLPQHRPWMVALGFISVMVVIATCGLGSYLLVKDESTVVGAMPAPTPTVPKRDITSRETDPELLTAKDVFPNPAITADPSIPPYKQIGAPQISKDCRLAATADLGKLLKTLGCNQVIRATFSTPDGSYFVTAGVFNLRDDAAAAKANVQIKALGDADKGRLSGYISHSSTRILGRAPTHVSWDVQGHFLIYSVTARTNGKPFVDNDAHLPVIRYDIVEKYLRDFVISEWSIDRSALEAEPSPSG